MADNKQVAVKTKTTVLSKQSKKIKLDDGWDEMKILLSSRKTIWDKLSDTKRKEWLDKAKDPAIVSAYEIHVFLTDFFGGYNG
jgi:hypothetical protein